MMESLLIANRGEIARRIVRTARRLGVRTVAVYSEADRDAPFVREADEAAPIGPAPAQESYLAQEKILAAARRTGAAAVHPGYGFLSENAAFAEAVQAAGLTWVGPPPGAIRAMGLKDAAKRLMTAAGVPVTPGYLGEDQTAEGLAREAQALGYPVLIKAVAGGGGKGMRRVDDPAAFADALSACRREAAAAFGDDRVLLETYVPRPRHIEVQVFGDGFGDVLHLFERDCSLQRRHQKVVEEAPAPGMDAETRAAVCGAAVKAARAVNYVGAGTIEFIADASQGLRADRIWFMEMNTRLQVEHPVTEAVTGQDLVEWQLRVADGEPLPLRQDELSIDGWAMEARLYAEDPRAGFLPSTGPLTHLRLPSEVRVDAGVVEGGEVTPFYDPLIAKLVAHGPSRAAAAAQLAAACRAVEAWPVRTNAAFLARIAADPDFLAAAIDTGFIERRAEALIPGPEPDEEVVAAAAAAMLPRADGDPWRSLPGFRINASPDLEVAVEVAGQVLRASAAVGAPQLAAVRIGGRSVLFKDGDAWPFAAPRSAQAAGGDPASDGAVVSPMPGRVVSIAVAEGETVAKGQALLVLEAMKMEHALTAPFEGVVAKLAASEGMQVTEGAVLVQIAREG